MASTTSNSPVSQGHTSPPTIEEDQAVVTRFSPNSILGPYTAEEAIVREVNNVFIRWMSD